MHRLGIPPRTSTSSTWGLGARPRVQPRPEARAARALGARRRPVILSVSAALPHKNLDRLLHAFARWPERPDLRLVLVGHAGRLPDDWRDSPTSLGQQDRVRFTGWIDQAELEGLYALAAAFAYPSLMEGFGLPVLEAMRRGVPVACSNASAMPEIAGDAALFFDPHDERRWPRRCGRLLDDDALAAELRRAGAGAGRPFSWAARRPLRRGRAMSGPWRAA